MDKRLSQKDVKPFSFQAFENVSDASKPALNFEFQDLSKSNLKLNQPSAKIIRTEREAEAKTSFKIDAIVKDLRGLSAQEKDDLESKISLEVEVRLRKIKDQAYREGLDKGRMEGADAALKDAMQVHQEQISTVQNMITDLQESFQKNLHDNQSEMLEMSKRLVKWLVLKEIQEDSYLPKLLEKLLLEMNEKRNLVVRVSPDDFKSMPQLLEEIQNRLGSLPNVRVEPDLDMQHRGISIESENSIVHGTVESLFKTIDRLYESVTNHE